MKVAVFDTHRYEKEIFEQVNKEFGHQLTFLEYRLSPQSVEFAKGCDAVCSFVNDNLNKASLERLKELGIKIIALRSAGYNHVDLAVAHQLGFPVVRVPEYSPHAVAEHTVALMLTLNRKIHKAYTRVRELNFSLEGLVGFDMYGKTIGVVGTGRIGKVLIKILKGFGCRILAHDLYPDTEVIQSGDAKYVDFETICRESDIISLNVPLTLQTYHMVNSMTCSMMKPNVILINTGRGALIETSALLTALKNHQIGGAGLDVYEEENEVFFTDHSVEGINDDLLARLITYPNVIITSHQAFLTKEALHNIAFTTLQSLQDFELGKNLTNQIKTGN